MRVFISYSSADREVAEEIQLALLGEGHEVFFDKDSLPAGGNYHARIDSAIRAADALVFLISPSSVSPGSYALTELKFARIKWPHPKNRVVPVRMHDTPWVAMPTYLKSVTVLEPSGNIAAEVLATIGTFQRQPAKQGLLVNFDQTSPLSESHTPPSSVASLRTKFWIALFGFVGVLGAALITPWEKIFRNESFSAASQTREATDSNRGMKGPDGTPAGAPVLNTQCPEVTFFDYSKTPPESTVVRRCDP